MNSQGVSAYTALWLILSVYAVLGAIDFGAGFYYWLAGRHPEHERVQRTTLAYLSPVWETTNVFLVLFIVGMIGFFPGSVRIYGTALLIPMSAAVILLTVRGAFFAFHHVAPWAEGFLAPVFGLGGLLVPATMVAFLSSAEDGAIRVLGNGAIIVDQGRLWLSPLSIVLALAAMALTAYLSASFLAWFATRRGDTEVAAFYRSAALRSGVGSTALGVALAPVLAVTAPFHFAALVMVWPVAIVSAVACGLAFWSLVVGGHRRSGLALIAVLTQIVVGLLTFGLSRMPYLVYPSLRLTDALTPPAMFTALMVTVVAGMVVILPSLALLFVLFVRPASPVQTDQPQPRAGTPTMERKAAHVGESIGTVA